MKDETYQQQMHCKNCGGYFRKSFEKGVGCSGFYTCEICGCHDAVAQGLTKGERW